MSLFSELKHRNVLRVAIAYLAVSWLLIQIVETLFPIFGLADELVRLFVIILVIGFPLILIFSWLYELTPEGLKLEKDVDRTGSLEHHTGKKLDRAIIVVLALALGYFAFDKFVLDPSRDAAREEAVARQARTDALVESFGENSIAVLPFVNMSDDASNEYFSDGISEELLNLLAKIPQLRVISRSSAFSFRGDDIDIPTLAEQLNVAHVLDGSVRKAGNNVRITAQLIEARSDTHLWSETYDRELDDIFAIQDEIAAKVVEQLKITLLGDTPATRKTAPEAYALFLQARYLRQTGDPGRDAEVVRMLEQALVIDPDYVPALLELSLKIWRNSRGNKLHRDEEGMRRSTELANKALAIDPNNGAAIAYRAFGLMDNTRDLEAAAKEFVRALQLDPGNVELLISASTFARLIGRHDEAIILMKRALELDPLCTLCMYLLSKTYMNAGLLKEAEDARHQYKNLGGQGGGYTMGMLKLLQGKPEAALASFEGVGVNDRNISSGRAMALYELGRLEEFETALADQIKNWGDEYPRDVATVYAWIADTNKACEWLEKAYALDVESFYEQIMDPVFRKMHGTPCWISLRERMGFSAERLAAIEFTVMLPE
jgi:TolB-like protein/Flp pilus assembly protein TadD